MSGTPPQGGVQGSQSLPETKVRFFSQEYADIQKLRELAGKNEHQAMKLRHKAAKYMTSMENYRYKATVAKERAALMSEKIAEVEARMKELEDELRAGAQSVQSGGVRPRDQSRLHLKIRRSQEKIVKLQRRSAYYASKNAHYLAVSSQKKVKADILQEQAKAFDIEANNQNTRADRLQQATSTDAAATNMTQRQMGR